MKDIIIPKKRIILETVLVVVFLLLAEGLNIYAIKKFNTNWDELWNQWLTVIALAALFYGLFTVLRIILKTMKITFKAMTRKPAPSDV